MHWEVAPVTTEGTRRSRCARARNGEQSGSAPGRRREVDSRSHDGDMAWEAGEVDLWEEMDWIARECGLTPTEKAVLSLARLDSHTHAEIAEELGLTPRAVAEVLVDALRKARARFERAASPRALFWEEIRQKSRCIYQRRRISWLR